MRMCDLALINKCTDIFSDQGCMFPSMNLNSDWLYTPTVIMPDCVRAWFYQATDTESVPQGNITDIV